MNKLLDRGLDILARIIVYTAVAAGVLYVGALLLYMVLLSLLTLCQGGWVTFAIILVGVSAALSFVWAVERMAGK